MKRFFSILLVAMLVVTSLATVAFAAGTATVNVKSVSGVNPGDEVKVTFTVSGEFANYELTLDYDPALTLKSIDTTGEANPNNGKVAFAKAENITTHSFTATFVVPADATKCSYPVSVTVSFVSDRDLVDQEVTVSAGAINLNHNWVAGKVITPAKCGVAGVQEYTCSRCGITTTGSLDALEHDIVDVWCKDETHHWHECSLCHTVFDKDEHDPQMVNTWTANGWVTEEWICSICEYEWQKQYEDKYDPQPQPGDITEYVVMGTVAAVVTMAGAVMLVMKRRAVK